MGKKKLIGNQRTNLNITVKSARLTAIAGCVASRIRRRRRSRIVRGARGRDIGKSAARSAGRF